MQETPTVQQPAPEPQPPIYPPHPYREYAAVEQPAPAPQPPTYQQQPPIYSPHPYREYAAVEQQYYGQPYYGPPVPPPKKKMGTGTKWLIGILVFLVIVLGAGTLAYIGTIAMSSVQQARPTPTQQPVVTPNPQPTLSAEDQYKQSATNLTIAQLVASGDQYKGKIIHITGIVQYSLVTDKGTSGMIILDPGATGKYVVAVFPDGTKMDVFQPGDNIHLWGLCLGTTVSGGETYSGMGAVYWTDTTSGITK